MLGGHRETSLSLDLKGDKGPEARWPEGEKRNYNVRQKWFGYLETEKVNETRTGWTMTKGSTPRMRLEALTGPWAWQRVVEKQRGVKRLTQEQMKAVEVWTSGRKIKSPFRFSLIHRSHLILILWSCLHPTVFPFVFHSGRTGIYLKFSLPPETPSKPELPHTDTQPICLIISGVSVAHTQRSHSSLSSACYKWAPSGPERSHLWEGLSWVKRTEYNWIMKWEAEGQVGQVCPYCPSHLRPGTSVMYLSKRNFFFQDWVKLIPSR